MGIGIGAQSNLKILVVEDDPSIQWVLIEALRAEGYEPIPASDGQEALDILYQCPQLPILVLLDLMMPRTDGWEFLRIKNNDPTLISLPVIVLSAVANKRNTAGANAFLPKPYSIDELLALIRRFTPKRG